jgi:hypothetical protein
MGADELYAIRHLRDLVPSQAQVFSSNLVGCVQVTIDSTTRSNGSFAMITNPLDQGVGNYAVSKLIPAPGDRPNRFWRSVRRYSSNQSERVPNAPGTGILM